jgi:uncharacterized protein (DUF1778 family)
VPQLPDDFDDLVGRTRARLDLPDVPTPYEGDDEDPVQLSIRLSPRLRHDIAEVARTRGQSVTGFVTQALEEAVDVATNPFAALAANMTAAFRSNLGKAVESGAYAEAAAEVDRAEGWDKAS